MPYHIFLDHHLFVRHILVSKPVIYILLHLPTFLVHPNRLAWPFHNLLVKQLLYHNRIKPYPLLPYHHYPDNNLPPALLKNQIVNYPNSFYRVPESTVKHNQHIPFLEVFPVVIFDLKAIMHYQDMFPYTSLPYQKFQMHLWEYKRKASHK